MKTKLLLITLSLALLTGCTIRGGWPRFLRPGEAWGWHGPKQTYCPVRPEVKQKDCFFCFWEVEHIEGDFYAYFGTQYLPDGSIIFGNLKVVPIAAK